MDGGKVVTQREHIRVCSLSLTLQERAFFSILSLIFSGNDAQILMEKSDKTIWLAVIYE